ncbi:MAG TPA: OB-fold domain-containing protein [Phototrophicaceae bacterium]|nr:OB-fold domain-containing protein [Phototrophicaceae bacterium]
MMVESRKPDVQTERFTFAGTGEIFSFTTVQEPPEGFEGQAPYVIGLIRLDEGPVITAQITDLDGPPQIGDKVEMVTRKLTAEGERGMIVYGYKFRKVLPRS